MFMLYLTTFSEVHKLHSVEMKDDYEG
jgi:hypothetical protein